MLAVLPQVLILISRKNEWTVPKMEGQDMSILEIQQVKGYKYSRLRTLD